MNKHNKTKTEVGPKLSTKSASGIAEAAWLNLHRSQARLRDAVWNAMVGTGLASPMLDRWAVDCPLLPQLQLLRSWLSLNARNLEHAREVRSALRRVAAADARAWVLLEQESTTSAASASKVAEAWNAATDNRFAAEKLELTIEWYCDRHPPDTIAELAI